MIVKSWLSLTLVLLIPGNLTSNTNSVGMQMLSGKYRHNCRSLRVYGLFGGKKEKNEKSDDAPSKVNVICFFFKVQSMCWF